MLAASYGSLLAPAIILAEELGYGDIAFVPVAVGIFLGVAFVMLSERCLPHLHSHSRAPQSTGVEDLATAGTDTDSLSGGEEGEEEDETSQAVHREARTEMLSLAKRHTESTSPRKSLRDEIRGPVGELTPKATRNRVRESSRSVDLESVQDSISTNSTSSSVFDEVCHRTALLVVAVTMHNFPEGLAIGVGFGSIGSTPSATFGSAFALAIGIGIQNFPEGMAVSLPLRRVGLSRCKSFLAGQSSGMVEPIGGVLGAAAVVFVRPILPYAMAFAAGAMVFVVISAIVPETASRGNLRLASSASIVGFVVMLSLDVALG